MHTLFAIALLPALLMSIGQSDPPGPGVARQAMVAGCPALVDTPTITQAGTVTYVEQADVKDLMADYTKREHVLKGYRVQIFLNADRRQAETMRAQFLQKHPEVPAYLSYQAPNFKVRVGDLLTRLEGEKLRAELKAEFPGCYIVPDEIELPRLPE